MTTSVSTIGPNTKTILVDNDTQAGVLSQISAILVASGWEIWDQVSTTNLVVRSKCYDGVNYKYLQVSVPATTKLSVTAWENWNNSTHVGTNQAYYNGNTAACVLTISLTSCNITVFSSNRYAVFVVNGAANMSAACFEFYRDNPTDLPASGFPNFFMTTYQSLVTSGGTAMSAPNSDGQIANNGYNTITVGGLPRNRYGDSAQRAAQCNALISMCGIVGGAGTYYNTNGGGGYGAISPATPLNNGNAVQMLASTPILICSMASNIGTVWSGTTGQFDWRGRVFGLKMLPYNFGQYGDITSLLCDSNGFTDVGGTAQDHFILGQIAIPL
jgi:hypothetical protein